MSEKTENLVLCGANSYEQKYYLNEAFAKLPQSIKEELQIMCVLYTEEVGGILTLEYEEDGTLMFRSIADDMDYYYDEISAGLKIRADAERKERAAGITGTLLPGIFSWRKSGCLK